LQQQKKKACEENNCIIDGRTQYELIKLYGVS